MSARVLLVQTINQVLQGLPLGDETALKNSALLLQQSRSGEGRQQLLNIGVADILPSILEPPKRDMSEYISGNQSRKILIWGLQLARNLCAAGEQACLSLVQTGLLKTVLVLLDASQQAQSCKWHQQRDCYLQSHCC